ncbi:uncharacterized protein TRIADDRAFT_18639 [Trichoplax adhaerens]|uniref:Fatty acid hydroxylase domain-containing protein n=1 Tax=Trichoplax adhaerens TaxID=10228 RepID=B3RIJ7_TRIAD|nr:hypothetical protein TRIADDRAFT_18639 [Trichoplax adhaerens]EDV29242.1 hypothetical protein TRIADDRAFT_18639 [Trichoplax adhaerens]|eukprot:XP_002108444.1 hypothetical protein TRIADDRAFT_18639 [Trichoplax adhaerens]
MDLVLDFCDQYFLTPYIYPSHWSEDWIVRQAISLYLITTIGGGLLYYLTATLNYWMVFDHDLEKHPHFLKDQVRLEIKTSLEAIPIMSFLTVVAFLLEVRGYSQLYDDINLYGGIGFAIFSMVSFLLFTDMGIYWIHRFLHTRYVYKYIHKPHHKWKIASPFASHAFHPIDGFMQSLPYHIYPFLFPLHKLTYLGLFVFVNIWTVSIHDGHCRVPALLRSVVNGSAHHTDHHVYFDYNYGQFFTLWDKLGKSYRHPSSFDGKAPLDEVKRLLDKRDKSQ